ncbi:prepilin-type N-terminal cleavage/methylation domain protein [Coleofasciculus chthonoplastes PCC 7420]|uniref:Prepilin-type N-terminal cleavage/methylation domain protein n=1 Tax=Coleofasciculus chthonoplastes PCC 7420 TaxID=118168 RepID=B4VMI6_9CYAN|nr:hormogonium polysaccharide secretion pseudopilin HpsB [Coleofasciculus chthonoplastes]EDX76678.1 prepilin-type N-terminal cleavage/methylation domain protein [Coleofasciculus chthonoplastes PCC 7420]
MMSKRQLFHPPSKPNQAGFTVIESLMAIIVVSILMIGLSPVIVLSVATRVQARRVERATQAARTYIDGLQAGTIDFPLHTVPVADATNKNSFAVIGAPNSSVNLSSCSGNTYCQNTASESLYCIDFDDDGGCTSDSLIDMIVQGYRSVPSGTGTVTSPENSYFLGVRVYRADAFSGGRTLTAGTQKATFTGGTGLSSSEAPLVEMTTEVNASEVNYQNLCDRLGGCN